MPEGAEVGDVVMSMASSLPAGYLATAWLAEPCTFIQPAYLDATRVPITMKLSASRPQHVSC
jgi:hypothetical protein